MYQQSEQPSKNVYGQLVADIGAARAAMDIACGPIC